MFLFCQNAVVRENRTVEALEFTELYQRLATLTLVRDKWAILLLLYSLWDIAPSGAGSAFVRVQPLAAGLEPSPPGLPILGHVAPLAASQPASSTGPQVAARLAKQLTTTVGTPRTARPPARTLVQTNEASEVPESRLLRDLVFVLQGIDGDLIKRDYAADAFAVDTQLGVSRPVRDQISKLAELGWLFARVRRYIELSSDERAGGLVAKAFCSALHAEMVEYYRLLAVLERQVDISGTDPEAGLTLKRLTVWTMEPLLRMRFIAALVDHCKGLKGGALLSAINSYAKHGDPFVQKLVTTVMATSSKPVYAMLHRWIYDGELDDPYGEFFIAADADIESDMVSCRCLHLHLLLSLFFVASYAFFFDSFFSCFVFGHAYLPFYMYVLLAAY